MDQDLDNWWTLVNTGMNIRVPYIEGNFVSSWEIRLLQRTLFHAVCHYVSVNKQWRLRGTRGGEVSCGRDVAGSITGDDIVIFPSGRAKALKSTHPLTEMSTANISCGVKTAGA